MTFTVDSADIIGATLVVPQQTANFQAEAQAITAARIEQARAAGRGYGSSNLEVPRVETQDGPTSFRFASQDGSGRGVLINTSV